MEKLSPDAVIKAAAGLFLLSLITAHGVTPYPIHKLGKRPMGKGIWTYLRSQLFTSTNGIWGYDNSLGCFCPIWRLSFHMCFILVLYSILLSVNLYEDDFWKLGIVTVIFYAGIFIIVEKVTLGVSHPGGPREHKIRRMPQWEDSKSSIDDMLVSLDGKKKWRCAVATDSHRATLSSFGLQAKDGENGMKSDELGMTGEPFGRQMWVKDSNSVDINLSMEQEKIIRDMARAGRDGFNPSKNPNTGDVIFREQMIRNYVATGGTLPDANVKARTVKEAARKGVHFYSMLQTEDGHWAGDYGGPHFLMPGLIIAWYIMGKPSKMLNQDQCELMAHYLKVHQQSDGGWGTHIESPSTMFGTVLCYVSLRLLGVDPNTPDMLKGRAFIQNEGGAIMTSSWAKFWLCLLGCMEWEGHNSVPPEMWLLPNWFPFHPGRLWCHCRMVYLPMGYLYGARFVYKDAANDPLIQKLREEIYCDTYESIEWDKTRHLVADIDNYSPVPFVMKFAQNMLAIYESLSFIQPLKQYIRKLGLNFCKDYMAAEDLQTNFIDIGPVNKVLNLISAFHAANFDTDHSTVQNHMMRIPDYLWVAEDGMKMQGYNGSQCWDTSFAIQAISECHLLEDFPDVSKKVWSFLERTQILSTEVSQSSPAFEYESAENRNKYYRHVSKGGWPFSTSAHGWPISDCTGEGLKGVCVLLKSPMILQSIKRGEVLNISESRLQDAVNVILTLQNEDGGWATYENNRGFGWYEQLNPSEVFGDIMIDYSYAECSMASLTALCAFHEIYPHHRTQEIKHAIQHGRDFFKSIQRPDGSWYGSWACCFCYGCWFGIEGLIRSGDTPSSPAITKCCDFLLSKQRENGGWGEDFTSCYDKDYAENGMASYGDQGSGVVNTAWALLALSEAKCDNVKAVKRGVQYLINRQLPCGDWPQEGISGVFNRSCGITYTAYRNIFPIWALGRCYEVYGDILDQDE